MTALVQTLTSHPLTVPMACTTQTSHACCRQTFLTHAVNYSRVQGIKIFYR